MTTAVRGDTCLFSALQTSSLNSCYVWIKTTGSGSLAAPTRSVTFHRVPCQLQTHSRPKRSQPWLLFPSVCPPLLFSPLSSVLQDISSQCHLCKDSLSRRRQNDVQKTQVRATVALPPPPNALIKHEACHVRLSWQLNVKISATSLWNRDAHVRSRPASSGQSCQDLLLKDSEDGNSERVQHR